MPKTILGIDPGTRYMGVAILRGDELVASGVHTLRNGDRPHDVIGQARTVVLGYIRDHGPSLVGIEQPLRLSTKRAALMLVIAQELHARSRELGVTVREISPREVRQVVVGDPHATKLAVAKALARRYPELHERLPANPPHPVLGYRPRDKYWLHLFDALAVAFAAQRG